MVIEKIFRTLRQPVITGAVLALVGTAALTAVPNVRSRMISQFDAGANLFLFEDEDPSNGDPSKDDNAFKRVVGAPFRAVARLFKRKVDDQGMKRATDKDLAKVKVVPLSRTQNGTDQIADIANGTTREASTAEVAAQNLFEEAVELHDQKRQDGAIEKLVAATVLQPNFAEAYNLLAICYDEKGQFQAAQDEYKKALKIESNNVRFLNNLGYSYYLVGDFNNSIKWYGKGLKVTPNDRRMHNNIGLAYGLKGNYNKAKEHFLVAVGELGANINLGYVYTQQGKTFEAIRHYEAALKLRPDSLIALSHLGQLYERTGRLAEATTLNQQYKKLAASAQQKEQTAVQDPE